MPGLISACCCITAKYFARVVSAYGNNRGLSMHDTTHALLTSLCAFQTGVSAWGLLQHSLLPAWLCFTEILMKT